MTRRTDEPRIMEAAACRRRAENERREAAERLTLAPPPWYQLRNARAFRRSRVQAWIALRGTMHEIYTSEAALAASGAGADPDEWGVLSCAPGMRLEHTLEAAIYRRAQHAEFSDAAARVLPAVGPARAAAVLVDERPDGIERAVLSLVEQAPESLRRQLIDHLPARVRPIPRTVDELDHHGGGYTRSVTESESGIQLHDIVMGPAEGRGFGTSLLQELCRYADRRGLPITCTMVVSFPRGVLDAPQDEIDAKTRHNERRLAGWYHRHGFRADKDVDEWTSFTALRREPATL